MSNGSVAVPPTVFPFSNVIGDPAAIKHEDEAESQCSNVGYLEVEHRRKPSKGVYALVV